MLFIPSHKKFELNENTQSYEKRAIYENRVYLVSIIKDEWTLNKSRIVYRWLHNHKNLISCTFPHGTIVELKGVRPNDVLNNGCEYCGKVLQNMRCKRKHMQSCRHKENVREMAPVEEQPITTTQQINNITNNNNNITITNNNNTIVQICDFGSENSKWITQEVLGCLYLDKKTAVKALLRSRHFNDKFPENQNIRIDTRNTINKRLRIFNKGKWRIRETKPVIELAIVNAREVISDVLNQDEEPCFGDGHHADMIRTFQGTERYRLARSELVNKWEPFSKSFDIDSTDNEEYQEYWEYVKTLLLDHKLVLDQQ